MKTILSFLFLIIVVSMNGKAQLLNKLKQKTVSALNNTTSSKPQSAASGSAGTQAAIESTTDKGNTESSDASSSLTTTTTSNNTQMEYLFIVLPDAKFYFSDKPFISSNTGAKTNFTSQEFIYGRLELGGKTVSEAFKLDKQPTEGFHYLNYGILITPTGKSEAELNYDQTIKYTVNNRSKPILIRNDEMKNTWLNFDVLATPSKITTLQGLTPPPDNLAEFKFAAGMDLLTRDGSIKQFFPANGDYTVQLVLWNFSFDDWGKPLESEKNIIAVGSFEYQFNAKDGATLMANSQKRLDGVRLAQAMKNKYTKLPDWWNGKSFTSADALMKPATLTPMIKNYCSNNGLTYISHKVYPYSGAAGWTIYNDSRTGFPVSRRLNAEAWTLYKDENGQCRFAVALIDEKYSGGGTYGSPYISGLSGEFIDCGVIK
ncbi:MAG: hypothetical protein JSS98_17335 [Bacteroidetes bacterium]|nr:hypothetical protein [Bacteroidota bacterium]